MMMVTSNQGRWPWLTYTAPSGLDWFLHEFNNLVISSHLRKDFPLSASSLTRPEGPLYVSPDHRSGRYKPPSLVQALKGRNNSIQAKGTKTSQVLLLIYYPFICRRYLSAQIVIFREYPCQRFLDFYRQARDILIRIRESCRFYPISLTIFNP